MKYIFKKISLQPFHKIIHRENYFPRDHSYITTAVETLAFNDSHRASMGIESLISHKSSVFSRIPFPSFPTTKTLGVSNSFPVLTEKTGTCVRSIDSMASRCIGGF